MREPSRANQPCHCGSGRTYKACCRENDRKLRMRGSTFTVTEPTLLTGCLLGSDGTIQLMSGDRVVEIADVKAAEWRETAGGLKLKSQMDVQEAFVAPEAALEGKDYVFGVDTNDVHVSGKKYHVACLTCATRALPAEPYEGTIQHVSALDFVDDEYPAERIGWAFALNAIARSIPPTELVALCTDHDVRAHTAINKRLQPIIADMLLPPNVSLVYAGDRGSAVQNKVIGSAHKGAKKIEQLLNKGHCPPQRVLEFLMTGRSSSRLRMWPTKQFSKRETAIA